MANRPHSREGIARRRARFAARPRILVVCEGTLTEPTYLNELRRQEQNRLIEVIVNDEGGAPKTIVERAAILKKDAERQARREKDDFLRYDEVWCVFDVDEHPNLPAARQQARDNHIQLAVSNPCFELWLLLHFQDQRAHLDRQAAHAACREHMPAYAKLPPFGQLYPLYEEAVARAAALENWQQQQDRVGGNPSTGVHRLTERIRELGREASIRRLTR